MEVLTLFWKQGATSINEFIAHYYRSETHMLVQGLEPNTKYEFAVRLHVDQLSSPWSPVVYHSTLPEGKESSSLRVLSKCFKNPCHFEEKATLVATYQLMCMYLLCFLTFETSFPKSKFNFFPLCVCVAQASGLKFSISVGNTKFF